MLIPNWRCWFRFSKYKINRWLKGHHEVPCWVVLKLIQRQRYALTEFLTAIVNTADLPSVADLCRQEHAVRNFVDDNPIASGIIAALNVKTYRQRERHSHRWVASVLGCQTKMVRAAITNMEELKMIEKSNGLFPSGYELQSRGLGPDSISIHRVYSRHQRDPAARRSGR